MFYNHQRGKAGRNLLTQFHLLLILLLIVSLSCESRLLDGSDNNVNNPTPGTPQQNFQRNYPPDPFFGPDGDSMIKTPSDNILNVQPVPNCTDQLPANTYPMPRCISNIIANYRLDKFDIAKAMSYRSKRRTSHLTTFFAEFVGYDLISSSNNLPDNPLYIPSDDATYNSYSYNSATSLPGQLSSLRSLPFNRSDFLSTATQKSKRNGYNNLTPFLDLSPIYGITAENAKSLREGNKGKLKTSGSESDPYPFKDPTTGNYVLGTVGVRSNNIFTMSIQTIWLREHNRLCDELYKKYGDGWNDDQYFEEARKWNIAFYQKVVVEEYLNVILGKQLPPYQKYDPGLTPGIDVFFSTVTFRYGHSDMSDFFRIQDENGDTVIELPLQNVTDTSLLEKFSVARLLTSLSLQHQEEVDIFYSDATRNIRSPEPNTYDLIAFDSLRARDRGIGLYNDVRLAYGLTRKDSWESITSVKEIQNYLQQLYPNGTNQLEALVGARVEDHLNDSNFGELMSTSMITQFMTIRNSDRFWWENKENGLFTDDDRTITLRNKTTFRDIILRNLDDTFQTLIPQNIWTVQPPQKLSGSSSKYPGRIALWPSAYVIGYEIVGEFINFQVQILTTGGNAWFGMGFDPDDNGGMIGADFVIGIISNGNISSLSNYRSNPTDYRPPMPDGDDSDLKLTNFILSNNDDFAIVEFSRPLVPNGRKGIKRGKTKYILAYNPTSSVFSYHQNNRQMTMVDFYNNQISSSSVSDGQRLVKLAHGIGMLLNWCVVFPASIFIVRYYKHTNSYIKIHRFLQLFGSICICGFGAASMATISPKTIHSWLGISIYVLLFVELGLGLISIWGQVAIVSVNQGYPRLVKRVHRFFGLALLISAWVNVYFGIDSYCLFYGYESLYYKIAYFIWIGMVIIAFLFGEYWWNFKGTWKWKYTLSNFEKENEKKNDKKSLFLLHIPKEDFDRLPEFTWSEVNERVQRGAYLVVCDGFIVNMRKWIRVHPGGAKILERVIGTDITNDFFGYKGKEIVEEIDLPEIKSIPTGYSTSILGQYTDILRERTKKYTTQKNSVAQVVDDMNVKYFLKAPLAIHPHSLFAIKKIATMIVAKLKETPDLDLSILQPAPIFGPSNAVDGGLSDEEMAKQDTAFRIKFRRYKLTSKVPINGSKKYPVMKFTFTINEQLRGYEIQVRGPFDVGDRENLQTQLLSQTVDASLQYRKSSLTGRTTPSFISSSTKDIINGVELEEYEISSRGMLTITYALNIPDQGWKGEYGKIDNEMISNWLSSKSMPHHTRPHKTPPPIMMNNNNQNSYYRTSINPESALKYLTMTPPPQSSSPLLITNSITDPRSVNDDNYIIRFHGSDGTMSERYSNVIINKRKPKLDPNSKIIVCGHIDMINVVEQSLKGLGYTEEDFILIA
ncbi:11050_t:CDS:10 [Entrophospora sp. SA101]|nr:11050_t:CDS:10 [Entrophospora sp. SA101]